MISMHCQAFKITVSKIILLIDECRQEKATLIEQLHYVEMRLIEKNESRILQFASGLDSLGLYNPNWAWNMKIKFILNRNKKGVSAREIADQICELEPENDANKTFRSVSAKLSMGIVKGYFCSKRVRSRKSCKSLYSLNLSK
jgi:hypothetical protein